MFHGHKTDYMFHVWLKKKNTKQNGKRITDEPSSFSFRRERNPVPVSHKISPDFQTREKPSSPKQRKRHKTSKHKTEEYYTTKETP